MAQRRELRQVLDSWFNSPVIPVNAVATFEERRRTKKRNRTRTTVLALALALSSGWLYHTWTARLGARPAPALSPALETPPLEQTTTSSPATPTAAAAGAGERRERHYLDRIRKLYAEAVHEGTVTYGQIVRAAYEPGSVTPQVWARKSAYRKRLRLRADFLADYRLRDDPVAVQEGRAVYDPLQGGWLRGLHSSGENLIILTRDSNPTILCHEAGHGLQKDAVFEPVNVSLHVSFAAYRAGRITDAAERRLRYLAGQRELEVSLQDLNRFHALVFGGRPIMDAREALTALHALGVPLSYEEARPVLDSPEHPLTFADFQARLRRPEQGPGDRFVWRSIFPDAHRLVELRPLAQQADATLWPLLLKKILLEAPGHL